MLVFKNKAKVNRASMEAGIMFDEEDDTDMALVNTNKFKQHLSIDNNEDNHSDNGSGQMAAGQNTAGF